MFGIVVATHGAFGEALIESLKMILGECEQLTVVTLTRDDSLETLQEKMSTAVQVVDPEGQGAVMLVDMMGGSPFNCAMTLSLDRKLHVVTGVNMPMLILALTHRNETDLSSYVNAIREAGCDGVKTSIELLKKK